MRAPTAREGKAKDSKDERAGQATREPVTHTACRAEARGEGKVGGAERMGSAAGSYREVTRNGVKNADERTTITRNGVAASCKVRRKQVKMM